MVETQVPPEGSAEDATAPASSEQVPPPTYAPSQPQILVAPLPDAASFFWGRTVQGEVFVKGLGEDRSSNTVKQLSVKLTLSDSFPDQPTVIIQTCPVQVLYPPQSSMAESTSTPAATSIPFSTINRFSIPLLTTSPLPGTLNLASTNRGQVKYELLVTLTLATGNEVQEVIAVEGTPPDLGPVTAFDHEASGSLPDSPDERPREVEQTLEKGNVRVRMLLDTARPRLGNLLRLGVEINPLKDEKASMNTGAGPSTRPTAAQTLRPLRRVRMELFRSVKLPSSSSEAGSSSTQPASSSSTSPRHLSLIYASGKSVRYPGSSSSHPPLRLLFTVPTYHVAIAADQTWGEITQSTPYHTVTFFLRVCIGFGAIGESSSSNDGGDWVLERDIEIRRRIWREPSAVVIERGEMPSLGEDAGSTALDQSMSDEQLAREAYRLKGLDMVGSSGTYRLETSGGQGHDLPPPFEGSGQSSLTPRDSMDASGSSSRQEEVPDTDRAGLPSFLESEAQMRAGEAPFPAQTVPSRRLVPVNFDDAEMIDRTNTVGRRGSLGGELGTWVEYDGYETFSVAPPSVSASFGVGGSMDPPQDGDEDVNVIGGMIGRLGLDAARHGDDQTGRDLIESLGLGEGTRVVDLQDDLPPGIDEPSLPALPDFSGGRHARTQGFTSSQRSPVSTHHPDHQQRRGLQTASPGDHPPSFDASEAAVERQRRVSQSVVIPTVTGPTTVAVPATGAHPTPGDGDAPPGYFGSTPHAGGPPAYS
ncbi:hypothetical protein BD324DRAFT_651027 [Kockovaella imperatae]|uniref:Uncharacterized protein n=1 Tax=Kockovaella imperatae TaxID=4999 RepID=A0A1Y1UIW0_9TREE|nr:hypothetical protein BD324DRAFT_651027 [Kockovaella imperatae]ORX37434.1 hypothetical protein BD324DRAFT_651027 [Kockovaella imperatae]